MIYVLIKYRVSKKLNLFTSLLVLLLIQEMTDYRNFGSGASSGDADEVPRTPPV